MNTLETIRTFLVERTNLTPEQITPEASLKELQIDSLMLLELIFECEEQFDLQIEQETITPETIADLIAIVEQATSTTTPAES